METLDFDTVFLKKFVELSSLEKDKMKDLFSNEDEFNQLKFTLNSINKTIESKNNSSIPSIDVKNRLDSLYAKTYQNKGILWYNSLGTFFINADKNWYNQNLVRIAAVFVVGFSVFPFLNTANFDSKVSLSKNEVKMKSNSLEKESTEETDNSLEETQDKSAEINSNESDKTILLANNVQFEINNSEMPVMASDEAVESVVAFAHPDGIFVESINENLNQATFSVKSNPDFLDLMTPTY